MKRLLIIALVTLLLLGAGGGAAWFKINQLLSPASPASKTAIINIPQGVSVAEIGRILQKAGMIRSAEAFRYLAAYNKTGINIKAGEHKLDASLSTPEILLKLTKGSYKLYRLTVPEGLTFKEIADLAGKTGLVSRDEFLSLCKDRDFIKSQGLDDETLEGYLFPETYFFTKGTSTRKIVQTMVDHFWKVWKKYQDEASLKGFSRKEVVTLASIVEKETGAAEERPMVAAVFLNRLKKGMRLETDPTVIYGVPNFDGNLTQKHLKTPTPYNTYIIPGLPPGPIANPGEASIEAIIHPADVKYLFFVSKNDGSHHFSRNLRDHINAVNKYQRRGSRTR